MIKAIPFDFPYDGRLVPQQTALLVIDLQEDSCRRPAIRQERL